MNDSDGNKIELYLQIVIHEPRINATINYHAEAAIKIYPVHPDKYRRDQYVTFGRWDSPDWAQFEGLTYEAQFDSDYGHAFFNPIPSYRQPYEVDLDTAERMAKTLRWIDRQRGKIVERLDIPRDFAQSAGYIAEAMGAKGFIYQDEQGNWWKISLRDGISRIRAVADRLLGGVMAKVGKVQPALEAGR